MPDPTTAARGHRRLLLTVCGATFLAMLDSTVANLAIPALHDDFESESVSNLSWVITSYLILFAALLASAGRLADAYGRRSVFLGGVGLFTLMSLGCALAGNVAVLVGFRIGQGVGAAAMIPAALAILLLDSPPAGRVRAIGLWSAASALAAAFGPAVGGVLIQWLSWRAVFYVNVPLGALVLVAAVRLVPRRDTTAAKRRVPDPLGTVLLTGGIGAITVGVTEGQSWGWDDPRTVACLVGGVLATAAAVARSRRAAVPAIESELWEDRNFLATTFVSLLYGMAQYPWLLGTILFVTETWHYSELQAGFAMTPGAVFASIAALSVGRAASRLRGPRVAVLVGLSGFLVAGVYMDFGVGTHPNYLALILPASFLAGSGMGAITYGTSMAAALSAPPVRFAGASGMNTMARQFGGALGVAALAVIMSHPHRSGLDAYRTVFVFCTVVVVIAVLVTWFGLKVGEPPAPAKPTAVPAPAAAR